MTNSERRNWRNDHYSLTDQRKKLDEKISEAKKDLRQIQRDSERKYQQELVNHTRHSRRFGGDVSEEREQLKARLTQIVCDKLQEKDRRQELRNDQMKMRNRMFCDEEQRRSRISAYRNNQASKK